MLFSLETLIGGFYGSNVVKCFGRGGLLRATRIRWWKLKEERGELYLFCENAACRKITREEDTVFFSLLLTTRNMFSCMFWIFYRGKMVAAAGAADTLAAASISFYMQSIMCCQSW